MGIRQLGRQLRRILGWRGVLRWWRWGVVTGSEIESPQNPRIKAWRALWSRAERERTGTFLIEGERETIRALDHLRVVTTIVRSDRTDIDLPGTVTVSGRAFERLSSRENPDGVAAIFEVPHRELHDIDRDLVLVADGIEKPGNIGAMIRTADSFGAAFVGSSLATDLFNPNVVRSAQGSLFAIPTAAADRGEVIEWIDPAASVIVASPDADVSVWETDLRGASVVVVGSEHAGVHPSWLDVGARTCIPTTGLADSLNASVAAAIFLAEAARQRST
jgi:TrmH family RNA methyltransferase